MNNQQQIEYWNGPVGERWASLQEGIDRDLGHITEGFMAFVKPKPGLHVLDIGCGCGTTTFLFADAVQSSGNVAGIDISAPMLSVARARASASNWDIAFIEDDASSHDFQPVFDLVVSRFGVMFFAEPAPAFRNIRRAIAPGGALAFVCWRSLPENGWAAIPMSAARSLLPPQQPSDPYAPGPFAYAERSRLEAILSDAGFRQIQIEKFDGHMDMGEAPEAAAQEALRIGPLARAATELDERTRGKIREVVAQALRPFLSNKGVLAPAACWFVRAS